MQLLEKVQRKDLKPKIMEHLHPTAEISSIHVDSPSPSEIVVDTIWDLLDHCDKLGDVRKVMAVKAHTHAC